MNDVVLLLFIGRGEMLESGERVVRVGGVVVVERRI